MENFFFTADEHYRHSNIIKYCNRPFSSIEEHDEELIKRHNEIATSKSTTVHVGDFTMMHNPERVLELISRLNGKHIFIRGSHDYWLKRKQIDIPIIDIWERKFQYGKNRLLYLTCQHHPGRSWGKSRHGSYQLFGHHHGRMPGIGWQMDVGVDTHDYYPWSLDEIVEYMGKQPPLEEAYHNERTYG